MSKIFIFSEIILSKSKLKKLSFRQSANTEMNEMKECGKEKRPLEKFCTRFFDGEKLSSVVFWRNLYSFCTKFPFSVDKLSFNVRMRL